MTSAKIALYYPETKKHQEHSDNDKSSIFSKILPGYIKYKGSYPDGKFSAIPKKHRFLKPVSRGLYENARLCHVHELDFTDPHIRNIPRAGVIFYTFIDEKLYLCFGRDKNSSDLTDFGGGKRQNEDPITCAIRESNEESRFAFSEIKVHQVQGFICLYSSNMLIIFIPVMAPDGVDICEITEENFSSKQFLNHYQSGARCFNEISDLVWLDETEISNIFSTRPNLQIFAKVRRFIYSCNDFSTNTNRMKSILYSVIKKEQGSSLRYETPSPAIQIDDYSE